MKKNLTLFLLLATVAAGVYLAFFRKSHCSLLVTGCARSGTTYISSVLIKSGLEIKHERMGKDGASSWYVATRPKYRKRGVELSKVRFDHVFHQVRDPINTISSVYYSEDRLSWHYIMKHTPEISIRDPHLVKCAKYWYYWNLKAEKFAEWTYRLEDIDLVWDEFCQRLGKKLPKDALAEMPKNVNTRGPHGFFTWEDLRRELDPELYQNIVGMARRYGYAVPE